MEKYPEHMKMKAIEKESQVVQEFLDFLSGGGYVICEWDILSGSPRATYRHMVELVAGYFKIDLKKLEFEKAQMIAEIRGEK